MRVDPASFGSPNSDRPRVLFVANPKLGWRTYSHRLIEVLQRRKNLHCHILWHAPDRLTSAVLRHHGGGRALGLDNILAHRFWVGRDIRRIVRDKNIDLVHFAGHWPAGSLAWHPAAPAYTVALDTTRSAMDAELARPVWSASEVSREDELCRRARHLFPMSQWTANSLAEDAGIERSRITVAPPAVDLAAFADRTDHAGPSNIIFIGNDFARKGGPLLLAAVEGPLAGKCHLHIVSADPAAKVGGLHTTVHGRVPQKQLFADLLPRMDLFCLPTLLDMSPNVLAEAAAAGLPAVATRIGGIPELVHHRKTGLLVPPADIEALIAALAFLLEHRDVRRRMGAEARRLAVSKLDAEKVFGKVADRLEELVGASRSAWSGR